MTASPPVPRPRGAGGTGAGPPTLREPRPMEPWWKLTPRRIFRGNIDGAPAPERPRTPTRCAYPKSLVPPLHAP